MADLYDELGVVSAQAGARQPDLFDELAPVQEPSWGDVLLGNLKAVPPLLKSSAGAAMQRLGETDWQAGARQYAVDRSGMGTLEDIDPANAATTIPENALTRTGAQMFREGQAAAQAAVPQNVAPHSLKDYTGKIVQTTARMAPGIMASLAAGNPAPAMALIGLDAGSEQYGHSREEGRTPEQASMDANFTTATEAGSELIPVAKLLKPGASMLGRVAKTAIAEGGTEIPNQVAQDIYANMVMGKDISPEQMVQNAIDALVVGGGSGAGLAVGSEPAVRAERNRVQAAEAAARAAQEAEAAQIASEMEAARAQGEAGYQAEQDLLARTQAAVKPATPQTLADIIAERAGIQPAPTKEETKARRNDVKAALNEQVGTTIDPTTQQEVPLTAAMEAERAAKAREKPAPQLQLPFLPQDVGPKTDLGVAPTGDVAPFSQEEQAAIDAERARRQEIGLTPDVVRAQEQRANPNTKPAQADVEKNAPYPNNSDRKGPPPPPGAAPALEVTREDDVEAGTRYYRVGDETEAALRVETDFLPNGQEVLRARNVATNKSKQRQGRGLAMYKRAISDAHADGMDFSSDSVVSPAGQQLWKRLRAEGYKVKQNPNAMTKKDGTLWAKNDEPVFSIERGAAPTKQSNSTASTPAQASTQAASPAPAPKAGVESGPNTSTPTQNVDTSTERVDKMSRFAVRPDSNAPAWEPTTDIKKRIPGITIQREVDGYGDVYLRAYVGDKKIGEFSHVPPGSRTDSGGLFNPDISVDPKYRRRGVATELYRYAEKLGHEIPPVDSPHNVRTEAGQAFREALARGQDSSLSRFQSGDATPQDKAALKKSGLINKAGTELTAKGRKVAGVTEEPLESTLPDAPARAEKPARKSLVEAVDDEQPLTDDEVARQMEDAYKQMEGSSEEANQEPTQSRPKRGGVLAPRSQAELDAEGSATDRQETNLSRPQGGAGTERARSLAQGYMKSIGRDYESVDEYVPVDVARAKRIAAAFESMKDEPNAPAVRRAYEALAAETKQQFEYLQSQGVKFEVWDRPGQPYADSEAMIRDVHDNDHLYFFPTDAGFGTAEANSDHPLLQKTGIRLGERELVYNDLFRAVHDFFGHAQQGYGFGPRGEENAWRTHARMFGDAARGAMTTETRGQNSWVNYGPYGEANQASPENTRYADQKTGLLPREFWDVEGERSNDTGNTPQTSTPAFKEWFGDSKVVDENGKPLVVYHGTKRDFVEFDPRARAATRGGRVARQGPAVEGMFFFTTNPTAASAYAGVTEGSRFNENTQQHEPVSFEWPKGNATRGRVMPSYLSLQNPLVIDATNKIYADVEEDALAQAKREGRDGIILRGVVDLPGAGGSLSAYAADMFIAFRPEQIKSAIGNRGTFDGTNPNILYSFPGPIDQFPKAVKALLGASDEQVEALRQVWEGGGKEEVKESFGVIGRLMKALVISDAMVLDGLGRSKKSPTMRKIARMFSTFPGSGETIGQVFGEEVNQNIRQLENKILEALGEFANPKAISARKQIKQLLRNRKNIKNGANPIHTAAARLAKILDTELARQQDAGVQVEARDNYFPQVYDRMAVMRDPEGFKAAATRAYIKDGKNAADAKAAAEALYENIMLEHLGVPAQSFGRTGASTPSADFTKSRTFTNAAQDELADFADHDPLNVLMQYARQSARKVAWERRFGGERWNAMKDTMVKEGVGDHIQYVEDVILAMTGETPNTVSPRTRSAMAWLRTITILEFLKRATITSLTEPIVAGVRTGNPMDIARAYAYTAQDMWNRMVKKTGLPEAMQSVSAEDGYEMSQLLGVAVHALAEHNVAMMRLDGAPESKLAHYIADRATRVTLLHPYTEATRVASVRIMQQFLTSVAKAHQKGSEWAKLEMRDLGVPDQDMDAFAAYILSGKAKSDLKAGGNPMSHLYGKTVLRGANQITMDPLAADKPHFAKHPVASMAYGLMSYLYSFWYNVPRRMFGKTAQALTNKNLTAAERARMMAPIAMFALIPLMQFALNPLRQAIAGRHDDDEKKKKRGQEKWAGLTMDQWTAMSRSNMLGLADPWFNMLVGAKYERDPASMFLGPWLGGNIQQIVMDVGKLASEKNSENTNTAERAVWKHAYNGIVDPLLAGASVAALNPLAAGLATQAIGRDDVREAFVSTMAGAPESKRKTSSRTGDRGRDRGESRTKRTP